MRAHDRGENDGSSARRRGRPRTGRPSRITSDTHTQRTGRFRLRNWPLRTKQVVVILLPTLTALTLGLLRTNTELANADEFNRTVTQVDLSSTVEQLVHDIQGER